MSLDPKLRSQISNTIRMMAADGVQKANSGHPGAPMGQADLALVLWHEFLRFDPKAPDWVGRDRFVLSCGHASMLLYSLLHLWGYAVSLEDIKQFRQWGSITPGHPELGHTAGVEITSGPLGQGVANAVGMALAAKMLSARIDVPGDPFKVMAQRIFALCGDGDLMEGISSEAASMAGHLQLDNLVWLYDDNKITIDGDTDIAFTEDVEQRFQSYGWRVLKADGHDADAMRAALSTATDGQVSKPTLIICHTHIGLGSPNRVDSEKAHGSPLGTEEMAATRAALNWPAEPFHVPDAAAAFFAEASAKKTAAHAEWATGFAAWRDRNPTQAATYDAHFSDAPIDGLREALLAAAPGTGATRKTSQEVLSAALALDPRIVGGSADLTGSNGLAVDEGSVGAPGASAKHDLDFAHRKLHFGIREHAMGAVANGMIIHGGLKVYNGTFLVFSDYMRHAVRLAALSKVPNIFVYTHDSVFLGEDGPTHQPVEHHWALRLIPDLTYFRPADGIEVAMAWAFALESKDRPVAFALTRQSLPEIPRPASFEPADVLKGAYAVVESDAPDVIFVGTGSELHLCTGAAAQLAAEGKQVRVISMPAWDLFEAQSDAYKEALLPSDHPAVVTVEAGITAPWRGLTGRRGLNIGVDRFGASAPAAVIAEQFGLTVDQIAARVRAFLS